ncbi:hypothetical protein D3273_24375 [Lichenibacterium minor]|uniref:Uncharacterized protein n=1 Tax=Lichenibacterium minor TaxID=2316528 RepID=A0A4Q2TZ24_9HYPH|nr:hypothetical protein [Lichenibacterium minor]RYC29379.1 hypothetical protein D3273_24375 [Lichenibacterium minor]
MTDLPDATAFEDAVYVGLAVGLLFASAAGVAAMRVRARRRYRFWLLSRNRGLFVACVLAASFGTCALMLRSIHYVSAHVSARSLMLLTPILLVSAALLVLSVDGWRSRRSNVQAARRRPRIG